MADRIYPSSKRNGTTTTTTTAAAKHHPSTTATNQPPTFPAPKSQLYNPNRHPYRPRPNNHYRHRCSRRRCFCLCCFWSILIIAILLLLATIAGAAVYVLYRPRRPAFSVSALRVSQFNLSTSPDDTTHLTTKLNLTISFKNPNKKLVYFYDPITLTSLSTQVQIANGSFPGFTSAPNNVTIIHCTLQTVSQLLDVDSVTSLKSDLKRKKGLPLEILLDTKVVVKMDGIKSKKIGIRVTCDGIHGLVPKGKSPAVVANTNNAKCKLDLRVKIWKWTF